MKKITKRVLIILAVALIANSLGNALELRQVLSYVAPKITKDYLM